MLAVGVFSIPVGILGAGSLSASSLRAHTSTTLQLGFLDLLNEKRAQETRGLERDEGARSSTPTVECFECTMDSHTTPRAKLHDVLSGRGFSGRIFEYALCSLIFVNVVAFSVQTVPGIGWDTFFNVLEV